MPTLISFPIETPVVFPTEAPAFPLHLGDVAGRRYLSLPDGMAVPVAAGLRVHSERLEDGVRRALIAVREIDRACQIRIRERYSVEDELSALRTGDAEVLAYVAQCVDEARAAKAALGVL